MDRRQALAALSALTVPGWSLPGLAQPNEAPDLPLVRDLRADGRLARSRRIPFLVLFSLPRCPYCNEVRRSYLLPMLRDPAQASRALFRQVNLGSDDRIVDFGGRSITHDALARRHDVRAAPVVSFWDPQGRPAAESIKGMLLPDFYGSYLESALEAARAKVAAAG